MVTYSVTTELHTPWWKKVLRFLRIIKLREEFKLTLSSDFNFSVGEVLYGGQGKVKVLEILY